jgi:hypothetical protein
VPVHELVAATAGQGPPDAGGVSWFPPDAGDPALFEAGVVPLVDFVDEQPAIATAITTIRTKNMVLYFTVLATPRIVSFSDRNQIRDRVAP